MPTKANTAIWNPATKPMNPCGNMPPLSHRFEKLAVPASCWNPVKIITSPVTMSATIATILISANQNSISPNAATVGRFRASRITITRMPGIHSGMPGISASV